MPLNTGESSENHTAHEPSPLAMPLQLPCGIVLANRIAKSAMTEGLANEFDDATDDLCTLYRSWASSEASLLITGNVMIDRRFLERVGNVVLDHQTDLNAVRQWAKAATAKSTSAWIQLNHPGRQCPKAIAKQPLAPSPTAYRFLGMFGSPTQMLEADIQSVIENFVMASRLAKCCGFTGVQIHAAHGYLLSQFLSPRINRREDQWGGSLENRSRLLLAVTDQVRSAVGSNFPVSVKINGADFIHGGFETSECAQVAIWLAEHGVDLVEVSGGTYENIAFINEGARSSGTSDTKHAYFANQLNEVRKAIPETPIMLTGGLRGLKEMELFIGENGSDMLGVARPFCIDSTFVQSLLRREIDRLPVPPKTLRLGPGPLSAASRFRAIRALNVMAEVAWYYEQLRLRAKNLPPNLKLSAGASLLRLIARDASMCRKRALPTAN